MTDTEKPVEHDGRPARPVVTVGVPVLNGEDFLAETLSALEAQTLRDLEVVISDNASADGTRAIAERFAARDPRFIVLPAGERVGLADNYNRTLAAARGRYFMWNAADDVARPDHLAACVSELEARPDAIAAFSQVMRIDAAGAELARRDDQDLDFDVPSYDRVDLFFRRQVYQVIGFGGVIRTATLRALGGHPRLSAGDNVLGIKLAMRGPWVQVPRVLFAQRVHDANISKMQGGDPVAQVRMFDPGRNPSFAFPQWTLTVRMYAETFRSPRPAGERCRAALAVFRRWTLPNWRLLAWDVKRNAVKLVRGRYGVDRWSDEARGRSQPA